jgi:hypothetical protein
MTIEYTIVITDEHNDEGSRRCQSLMLSLTDFINDHTIHQAYCLIHDTSLPATEEQVTPRQSKAYTDPERRQRFDTVVYDRRKKVLQP